MAKRAVLITGGEEPPFYVVKDVFSSPVDLIIACDSGMERAKEWGITPDYLIGDMDSADADVRSDMVNSGIEEVRLNPRKNDTDTEAGAHFALSLGAEELVIIGGTGGRLDHTAANLHVLYALMQRGVAARMEGKMESVRCINGTIRLRGEKGKTVSILPMFEDCLLSLHGFRYPLERYAYRCGSTVGTSNVVTAEEAVITVHEGSAFLFVNRRQLS